MFLTNNIIPNLNSLKAFFPANSLNGFCPYFVDPVEYKQSIDPAWIADAALAVAVIPTLIYLLINADTTDPDPS